MKRSQPSTPAAATGPTAKAQCASPHPPQIVTKRTVKEMEHRRAFLEDVKKDPWELEGSIYVDDKEVVLAATTDDGWVLQFASKTLRADKEIVLAAITNNASALQYASKGLRADKEIVLVAVTNNGWVLKWASKALQTDKDIVLAAVTNKGGVLRWASRALQADQEVVMTAVTAGNGVDALEFASLKLRDCTFFVQSVILQAPSCSFDKALKYFPGLQDTFLSLYWKLKAVNSKKDCGNVLPHIFAEQWLARLEQAQNQESGASSASAASNGNLARDMQTANLLQTYSPILTALQEKSTDSELWEHTSTESSCGSWWALLEWFSDGPHTLEKSDDESGDESSSDSE